MNHKQAENKCWEAMSEYIRARDPDCWTCDARPSAQAGHLIPRAKKGTKFNEDNVHGQCAGCNWADKFKQGYHDFCVGIFIAKMGHQKYLELVALSRTTRQFKTHELIAMTEDFKKKKVAINGL